MANSIGSAALLLSADSAALSRDLAKAQGLVDDYGNDVRRTFRSMSKDIEKEKLFSSPANISRQVALEGNAKAAKDQRNSLLAAERINQGQGRFGQMGKAIGLEDAGIGLDKLVAGLGKFGPYAAVAAAAIGVMIVGAIGLWKAVIGFASAANPVAAERYQKAWDDLNAVIGRIFVPILDFATDAVRLVADVFASILPSAAEMREAFAGLKDVMIDMRKIAQDLAPAMKAVVGPSLKGGASLITAPLGLAAKMAGSFFNPFGMFGGGGGGPLQSSFNASGSTRSFVGLEDLGKQDILKSLDQSVNEIPQKQLDVAEKTAATVEGIRIGLGTYLNFMNGSRALLGF